VTAGVPQGPILGPFLWNVAYDSLLALPDLPEGTELVAYADDLAVMVTAKNAHTLQDRTRGPRGPVHENFHRTLLFPSDTKCNGPYGTGERAAVPYTLAAQGKTLCCGTRPTAAETLATRPSVRGEQLHGADRPERATATDSLIKTPSIPASL